MKEVDKKNTLNSSQKKRSPGSERRDRKLQDSGLRTLASKEIEPKTLFPKPDLNISVGDSNTSTDSSAAYEDMVIHYVDDNNRVEASQDLSTEEMVVKEYEGELNGHSGFSGKEQNLREQEGEESDTERGTDSVSSKGDAIGAENDRVERPSTAPGKPAKNGTSNIRCQSSRLKSDRATSKLQSGAPNKTPQKGTKSNKGSLKEATKNVAGKNSTKLKFPTKPSSESSESVDEKPLDDLREVDISDESLNGAQSVGSDVETVNAEENGSCNDQAVLDQKIEEMENRIEKLEQELKEVAALEIALYSVVPEHGSSAHKVHTPARRLSRLYIHACKYWSQDRRATVASNTVSGLVLVAKSCSNDVQRLTFWLSNTVVLRENISQTFGSSCNSNSIPTISELNGNVKKSNRNSLSLKWRDGPGNTHDSKHGLMQFVDDWQETRTFTAALEKIESWIFSRIVESIWWQTLTPSMQSPLMDSHTKVVGRLLGPALGDQHQGNFSVNLWNNVFQDASRRLCPVRAGGHECGCLPVLARMVMEQCVSRLDVAMFNAILRESAHEIPTDPVSDPIVDSKVLPIPAGDLSFGSGAQLKNSVGNWSRSLIELFGTNADCSLREDNNNDETSGGEDELKHFDLLNTLSDLLMLPKDMLLDSSVRKEVCPSISLPLVRRILCNFTPDEFCPDPVPGAVLEAVNAECIIERRLSGDTSNSFPYNASPIVYTPPSMANIAEKVAEAGGKSALGRNASVIQRKGYTSDEELDELDSPLTSIIDKLQSPRDFLANGNPKSKEQTGNACGNTRYELLRQVWSK